MTLFCIVRARVNLDGINGRRSKWMSYYCFHIALCRTRALSTNEEAPPSGSKKQPADGETKTFTPAKKGRSNEAFASLPTPLERKPELFAPAITSHASSSFKDELKGILTKIGNELTALNEKLKSSTAANANHTSDFV